MKLKDVIRLQKKVTDYGQWYNGDIDRSAWPLKKKKLKQSRDWSWRVICLQSEVAEYRILLKLNASIEQFYAVLAVVRGEEIAIICSHELHTSHANWHCHSATKALDQVFPGVWRDSASFRRWPSYDGECTERFEITEVSAVTVAADLYRFKLPAQGELFR